MDLLSTPFIRNDYWPDYNQLNVLNNRINAIQDELNTINTDISANIDVVNQDLQDYKTAQRSFILTNNAEVNLLEAHNAVADFANFDNTFVDSATITDLVVTRPIFNAQLVDPDIQNVSILYGNVYEVNIHDSDIFNSNGEFNALTVKDLTVINPIEGATLRDTTINNVTLHDATGNNLVATNVNISGNSEGNFSYVDADQFNATNAWVDNLFINVDTTPIFTGQILGPDASGRVVPVDISMFPPTYPVNADYISTDEYGEATANISAKSVIPANNLIT